MIKFAAKQISEESVKIINELIVQKISIQASVTICKVVRVVSGVLDDLNKQRSFLANKYIIKDENGQPAVVKDEQGNVIPNRYTLSDPMGYHKEMNDLLEKEYEIDVDKLQAKDFTGITIEPKSLLHIAWMFKDFE